MFSPTVGMGAMQFPRRCGDAAAAAGTVVSGTGGVAILYTPMVAILNTPMVVHYIRPQNEAKTKTKTKMKMKTT